MFNIYYMNDNGYNKTAGGNCRAKKKKKVNRKIKPRRYDSKD